VNVLECNNPTILLRLDQARTTSWKNVIVGETRKDEPNTKIVSHKVALEKDEAGKNNLKIIVGSF
jgi:hypothetical protein